MSGLSDLRWPINPLNSLVFNTPLPYFPAALRGVGRMQGARKDCDEDGHLNLAAGEYGKDKNGDWMARPFGGHLGNLSNHEVVEHEDGTITVSPSILITAPHPLGETRWHGYLERGIWRQVA